MSVTAWRSAQTAAAVSRGGQAGGWTVLSSGSLSSTDATEASFNWGGVGYNVYSGWLVASDFGFSSSDIPSGVTITGLEFRITRRFVSVVAVAEGKDSSLKLTLDASTPSGTEKADTGTLWGSQATVTYGGSSDLCGLTPQSSDLIASGFGVMLSSNVYHVSGTPSSGITYVDQVEMRVHWTSPASSMAAGSSVTASGSKVRTAAASLTASWPASIVHIDSDHGNGGFEVVGTGGQPLASWTVNSLWPLQVTRLATSGRDNQAAAQLVSTSLLQAGIQQTLVAGQLYAYRFWAKNQTTSGPTIRVYMDGDEMTSYSLVSRADWTECVGLVVGKGTGVFEIRLTNAASRTVLIDDVVVTPIDYIIGPGKLNGDFETAGAGGADVFASWTEAISGTSTINSDNSIVYTGTKSLRMDIDASNSIVSLTQSGVISNGVNYRVLIIANSGSASKNIRVANTSVSGALFTTATLSQYWAGYSGQFTSAGTSFALCRNSTTSASVWVDTIYLTIGDTTKSTVEARGSLTASGASPIAAGSTVAAKATVIRNAQSSLLATGSATTSAGTKFLLGQKVLDSTASVSATAVKFLLGQASLAPGVVVYALPTKWLIAMGSLAPSSSVAASATAVRNGVASLSADSSVSAKGTPFRNAFAVLSAADYLIAPWLRNGGFEIAGGGVGDRFATWSETTTGLSTLARDLVDFYGGGASALFSIGSDNGSAGISQSIITNGSTYNYSFFSKANVTASIVVGGNAHTVSTSWTQYRGQFAAISSSFAISRGASQANKQIWMDDILLWTNVVGGVVSASGTVTRNAASSLSSASVVSAKGTKLLLGQTSVSAGSTVSAKPTVYRNCAATLSASSSASATARLGASGKAILAAGSTVSGVAARPVPAKATIVATAGMTAMVVRIRPAKAALLVSSVLSGTPKGYVLGQAVLSAAGTSSGTPVRQRNATIVIFASASLSPVSQLLRLGVANLPASSTIVSGGRRNANASASLAPSSAVAARPSRFLRGYASLAPSASINAQWLVVKRGFAVMHCFADMRASDWYRTTGLSSISAVASVVPKGTRQANATASMAATATVVNYSENRAIGLNAGAQVSARGTKISRAQSTATGSASVAAKGTLVRSGKALLTAQAVTTATPVDGAVVGARQSIVLIRRRNGMQPVQINEPTGAKRRLLFFLVLASDGKTPYTGGAGIQPTISTNGGALSTSNVGALVSLGGGHYYAEVTLAGVAAVGVISGFVTDANLVPTPSLNALQVVNHDPYSLTSGFTVADIWNNSTRTLSSLGAGAIQSVWDAATSGMTVSGSVGKRLSDNLNATVSSRSTFAVGSEGVKIAADGLDLIPLTEFNGRPTTFRQLVVALYMRFFNRVDQSATQQKVYRSDGVTVAATMETGESGGVQTKGGAS